MRLVLVRYVGATLVVILSGTLACAESSSDASTTVSAQLFASQDALPEAPVTTGNPHMATGSPVSGVVPTLLGYEYLANPCQANTVGGYSRMFDF